MQITLLLTVEICIIKEQSICEKLHFSSGYVFYDAPCIRQQSLLSKVGMRCKLKLSGSLWLCIRV